MTTPLFPDRTQEPTLLDPYSLHKRNRDISPKRQSDSETTGTRRGSLDASASEISEGGYELQLGRTQLLFVPSLGPARETTGTVVQVSVRSHLGDGDVSDVEQATVTTTIETLIVGHVTGLYKLRQRVTVKEVVPGYDLVGRRRPWRYGRGKTFCLGDTTLEPAQDKWIFHFEKRE